MNGLHEHAMPAAWPQPKRETVTPTLIHRLAICHLAEWSDLPDDTLPRKEEMERFITQISQEAGA